MFIKYVGSKARIAKHIVPILNETIRQNNVAVYIEPFVGGANMIEHIECEKKIGLDNNEYLIAFWKALQGGWNPLVDVTMTKELYDNVRQHTESTPPHIVALAGFCATYNAKWFGGYAGIVHTKIDTYRNYYDEAVRNVLSQVERLKNVEFYCMDFKDIQKDLCGAVIYLDPPYEGKTGYKDSFDHKEYWEWVRKMSLSNFVFASEYQAPNDFECAWSKEITTTLDKSSRSQSVERLFTYSKGKYILN